MVVSWASIAACPRPVPTPQERWETLVSTCASRSTRLTLLEVLGLLEPHSELRDSPAAPLVEHCVIVGVDTEAWTLNTDEMTEIGLVIAEYKNGKELNRDLGPFAENLFRNMRYHHLRIWENAHLRTSAEWMRGPEGNRFGKSRFVTFTEARTILDEILNQPIISSDPSLAGLKRPVILIGHALIHDRDNLQKDGLQYDFKQHGTVVKEIDTQKLTKEVHAWADKTNPNNEIGLDKLCEDVFGFEHDDAHTALNDAARTVICAVNLALGTWTKKKKKTETTMQEVTRRIEEHSQFNFSSKWGTEHCCTRCGSRDHNNNEQQCLAPVTCEACKRFDEVTCEISEEDKLVHIGSHLEQFCMHVAQFNGWRRRVMDAHRKRNVLPPGPPPGSHPRSDWRGKWPMSSESDAFLLEVPKKDQAANSAHTPLATSMPPLGVKVVTFQSTGRAHAEQERRIRRKKQQPIVRATVNGSRVLTRDTWRADDAWNGKV
ncbi:hypothetical protein GQ44DRAFT_686007 [Phaeosphaeriaceae sp. PMI808]|nr:hypothetical protein GQ44DRAFT_686007 [Phaeosphaeriaceae sp. PMI808]